MLMEAASPERLGNHRNAPAPLQAQAEPRVPRLPRFLPPPPQQEDAAPRLTLMVLVWSLRPFRVLMAFSASFGST